MNNLKLALLLITVTNLGNYALMGMNSKKRVRSDSAQFDPELVPQATRHRLDSTAPASPDNDVEMAQDSTSLSSSSSSSASTQPSHKVEFIPSSVEGAGMALLESIEPQAGNKSKDHDDDHLMVERKVNAAATQSSMGDKKQSKTCQMLNEICQVLGEMGLSRPLHKIVAGYHMSFNPWDSTEDFQDLPDGILRQEVPNNYGKIFQIDGAHIAVVKEVSIDILKIDDQNTQCIATLTGYAQDEDDVIIESIIKLKDGRIAFACNFNDADRSGRAIKIWDLAKGSCVATIEVDEDDSPSSCWFTLAQLEDDHIASLTSNTNIQLWDPITYQLKNTLTSFKQEDGLYHAVWSYYFKILRDGKLASYDIDGTISIWDTKEWKLLARIPGLYGCSSCDSIAQLKDGTIISAVGEENINALFGHCLRLWEPTKNHFITVLPNIGEPKRSFRNIIALTDTRIAFSDKATLVIWDTVTKKNIMSIKLNSTITRLMLLDNFKIVCQTDDDTLTIWQINPKYTKMLEDGLLPTYEKPAQVSTGSASSSSSSSSSAPMNLS